jgi:F-type H+-transporting ATPase subunit b
VDLNATIIGQSIAMIVFVWFCMKFIWPLIIDMLEARQTQIAEGLANADKGNRALQEAEVEKATILTAARGQAREIIDLANTRASSIVEEARAEAGAEKSRIIASAQLEVEQEANRAREELRTQVAAVAIAGAQKILRREIDAAAHKDLLDRLAAEI